MQEQDRDQTIGKVYFEYKEHMDYFNAYFNTEDGEEIYVKMFNGDADLGIVAAAITAAFEQGVKHGKNVLRHELQNLLTIK